MFPWSYLVLEEKFPYLFLLENLNIYSGSTNMRLISQLGFLDSSTN